MWSYYRRLWATAWKDFLADGKEQLIGALLAIVILVCQIAFGAIHKEDVRASSWALAWPYILLVLGLVVRNVTKAPYTLDQERQNTEQNLREEISNHVSKPEKLTSNPDLRSEALALSKSILDFYYARSKDAPELPECYPVIGNDSTSMLRGLAELNQQQIDAISYKTETKEIYEYKFRRELRELVLRIKESGVTGEVVDSLEGFTEGTPSEVFMIKVVASDLATIADRIPAP